MKRALLFLLLVGTGLAILFLLQGDRPEETEVSRPGEVEVPAPGPTDPGIVTPVPGEEGQATFSVEGRFEHTQTHAVTGKKLYSLVTENVHLVPGGVEMHGVSVKLYDEQTGELQSELDAEQALVFGHIDEGGKLVVEEETPSQLEVVEVRFLAGVPLAPLRATAPKVELRLGDRRLTSDSDVLLEGSGLRAEGRGLLVEERAASFRLLADPRVHLRLEDGARGELSSRGPVVVTARETDEGRAVTVVARQEARLDLREDEPGGLTADVIELDGDVLESESEEGESFVPRTGSADGSVVLRVEGGEFFGDSAELGFDADGAPREATLAGNPRVELDLSDAGLEDLGPDVEIEGDRIPLDAEGTGPLRFTLGQPSTFHFAGPVQISLPSVGATLEASSSLVGVHDRASGFSSLVATGNAVAHYGDATMNAEEIDLGSFLDPDGERVATLAATSSTHTTGTLPDGRHFTLDTEQGIVVERRADSVRVPRAGGVELKVEGENGFTARADDVRNLDVDAVTFVAEGNVSLEGEQGKGSGHRLEARGIEHMELVGTPEAPARFEIPEGVLEGGTISRDGEVIDVSSNVHATMAVDDQEYELRSRWARVDRTGRLEGLPAVDLVVLDAGGEVTARVADASGWKATTRSDFFRVTSVEVPGVDGKPTLDPVGLAATGNVHLSLDGDYHFEGEGQHLEVDADGAGALLPGPGERTHLSGDLVQDGVEFDATGGRIDFSLERVEILDPVVDLNSVDLPGTSATGPDQRVRVVAGRMVSDRGSILLTDGAYIGRFAEGEPDWALDAEKVLLIGGGVSSEDSAGAPSGSTFEVEELLAWGGFTARFGDDLTATGEQVHILGQAEELQMAGAPAQLLTQRMAWEADWFDVNMRTGFVRAGSGRVRSVDGDKPWSLSYTSVGTVELPDSAIQVIREPIIVSGGSELRAAWALFWVDSREWARTRSEALGQAPLVAPVPPALGGAPRVPPSPQSLFGVIAETGVERWLQEVYLEGNIEYHKDGERTARSDAVYFDLVDGHGWMREFDLLVDIPFVDRAERITLSARWMHHGADGSFNADSAVATLCEFEDPHYVIRIGNLAIKPKTKKVVRPREDAGPGEEEYEEVEVADGWDVAAEKSEVELFGKVSVPVPPLKLPVTEDMNVDTSRLSLGPLRPFTFGSDQKLGNFVGTSFTNDLGRLARGLHNLISGDKADFYDVKGQSDFRVSWNGARGLLGGFTTSMESPGLYDLEIAADGLFDSGDDKGIIRVDQDDRSSWRSWVRARGRYLLGETEWLDLVITSQTDPGVQSEFFESDFLRYEEDETFLHWRRADGVNYYHATLEARLDDFRTDVIDQPLLGHIRGRSKVADLTDEVPLQYTSQTSFGYLKRREGDPQHASPFQKYATPFRDGFGEAETLRADTRQRLETPLTAGKTGIRATPFVEGRATGWLENEETSPTLGTSAKNPARLLLSGGIELAATFWRAFSGGKQHALTPFATYRETFLDEGPSEPLVLYDRTELPQSGRYFDLGIRTRWTNSRTGDALDLEFVDTYATDVDTGLPDGWLPLRVHGTYLTDILGMGFGVYHDARYDIEQDETPYSRTLVGFEPIEVLEVDAGYHSARDVAGSTLYNALSLGARYSFSPKWELEGSYTHSTLGDGRLASDLSVRRFGHDFVFAFSTRFNLGEGGASFQFDVVPLITYRSPSPGLVSRWREKGL